MDSYEPRTSTTPIPQPERLAGSAHKNLGPIPSGPRLQLFDTTQAAELPCHVDDPPQQLPGGLQRLVSSHAGPLRRILLAIPNYVLETPELVAVFRSLAIDLPARTHIVILTQAGAVAEVTSWFGARHALGCEECRIVAVTDQLSFTMWAEDPYAAGIDARGRHALIEPDLFDRNADNLIATLVAADAGMTRLASPLTFQGGNVLVGDNFYLVGADYLHKSLDELDNHQKLVGPGGVHTQEIRHAVQRDFLDANRRAHFLASDLPLMVDSVLTRFLPSPGGGFTKLLEHVAICSPGGTLQPIFHIDMFISLAGRSPRDGKFVILVGDPRLASQSVGLTLPDHAQTEAFDDIAEKLAERHEDFHVKRNPLPYVYRDYDDAHDGSHHRWWYYASSNNAIVQDCGEDGRRVWLPTFGGPPWPELAKTDAMNRKIWNDLGYEVTMLPNCHALAENMGVLHCLKKYLAR